jgi:hypothetical protein
MNGHTKLAIVAGCVVLLLGLAFLAVSQLALLADNDATSADRARIVPLGVLGDSDSHAYQDRIRFGKRPDARGGAFRSITFQWTEILHLLRPQDLDPGRWGSWGTRRFVAVAQRAIGLPGRTPKKEDFQYNFAISGSVCADLLHGPEAQLPQLLQLMGQNSDRWQDGVIVVRMGMNDFGHENSLNGLAGARANESVLATIDSCVQTIRETVSRIRNEFPRVRIVLVGIFDNSNWVRLHDRWVATQDLQNIRSGLDRFDLALQSIVAGDTNLAFFNDRAWFSSHWGDRDESGNPDYGVVRLDGGFETRNSEGDDPGNATLADGHAGLVWNALWAQALVDLLNVRFQSGMPPITDFEISQFIERTVAAGPGTRE